jgi:hypothetical protein
MFNIFKRSEYVNPELPIPVIKPGEITQSHYSVGITNQGLTQLKLHDGDTTMTLTLTQVGVNQIIRLLSATLPECPECCENDHE